MDVFDASSRRVKLLKSTSCQDSPPHIMVMPVGTFVIVQTPQAGTAEYGARAAATQCQDVRLHYLCSGVYLIPVASSADGKMSPESFELVRLITTSTQWKHMPNCRSGPDAQWDRHLRRRRYGLASCRGQRPQSRHPISYLKARLRCGLAPPRGGGGGTPPLTPPQHNSATTLLTLLMLLTLVTLLTLPPLLLLRRRPFTATIIPPLLPLPTLRLVLLPLLPLLVIQLHYYYWHYYYYYHHYK